MTRHGLTALGIVTLLGLSPAAADLVPLVPVVKGNNVFAQIPLGKLAADLTIAFESVEDLSGRSLTLAAGAVDPADPALTSRLPAGVSIPAAFPVLVRIEPPPGSPLSFLGVARVTLHTGNLHYGALCPYRLFRAPTGGAFTDITTVVAMGSVRAGGSTPGFSEYLVVADLRPTDLVIGEKFDALDATLAGATGLVPAAVLQTLSQLVGLARMLYLAGDLEGASDTLGLFLATVETESGSTIPDRYRADGTGPPNVAGALRARTETLRFSLAMRADGAP